MGPPFAQGAAKKASGRASSRVGTTAVAVLIATLTLLDSPVAHGQQASSAPAEQLRACYTKHMEPQEGATFKAFLDSKHPWLRLHEVLWSQKQPCKSGAESTDGPSSPHHLDNCALTVATTLTVSRLDGLERLCGSWPGPLAAALYVPLEQAPGMPGLIPDNKEKLAAAVQAATALFNRVEAQGSSTCALRLLILYEVLLEHSMHLLIPINSLRNAALLAASTPMVSMIDVDLMISASLGQQLVTGPSDEVASRAAEAVALCRERGVLILPAFEPHTMRRVEPAKLLEWADSSVTAGKAQLQRMVAASEMCFFQEMSYPRGHRLTDFPRWHKSHWPYQVFWQMFYEPWFIVGRALNPWYDVRFQGYGYNKQNHVADLAIAKFKFMVHPDAFVVHRPHNKTNVHRLYVVALNARAKLEREGKPLNLASNFTSADSLSATQIGTLLQYHVKQVFLDNMRDMRVGKYTPQKDQPTKDCLAVLPWWKAVH